MKRQVHWNVEVSALCSHSSHVVCLPWCLFQWCLLWHCVCPFKCRHRLVDFCPVNVTNWQRNGILPALELDNLFLALFRENLDNFLEKIRLFFERLLKNALADSMTGIIDFSVLSFLLVFEALQAWENETCNIAIRRRKHTTADRHGKVRRFISGPLVSYLDVSLKKHNLFKESHFNKVRIYSDVCLFSMGCRTIVKKQF